MRNLVGNGAIIGWFWLERGEAGQRSMNTYWCRLCLRCLGPSAKTHSAFIPTIFVDDDESRNSLGGESLGACVRFEHLGDGSVLCAWPG